MSEEIELPAPEELVEKGVDLRKDFKRVDLVTMDYFIRQLKDGRLDFSEVYAFEKAVDPEGITQEWWRARPPRPDGAAAPAAPGRIGRISRFLMRVSFRPDRYTGNWSYMDPEAARDIGEPAWFVTVRRGLP